MRAPKVRTDENRTRKSKRISRLSTLSAGSGIGFYTFFFHLTVGHSNVLLAFWEVS